MSTFSRTRHIASYLNGQSIKDGLNKIEICTKDECDELSIDGKKRGETDSIVRFLRKLLSAIKELFQLFVTFFSFRKLASLLAIIIMILAVILCAAIFITGVCTWASIPFPSIGEGWCDDFSLIEKIMVGLFGISFGGVGLDKIKEKIFG